MSKENWEDDEDFTKYLIITKEDGTPVFTGKGLPEGYGQDGMVTEFLGIATGEKYVPPEEDNLPVVTPVDDPILPKKKKR